MLLIYYFDGYVHQVLPVSKSSQMITFYFENGCVATLRTSGTEPKIKYYTEFACKPGEKYVVVFHCLTLVINI